MNESKGDAGRNDYRQKTRSQNDGRRGTRHAYRVSDACSELGIGKTTLYDLAKRGEIKLIKIASRTLVPGSEIERLTNV